jgi:hypothetical protein
MPNNLTEELQVLFVSIKSALHENSFIISLQFDCSVVQVETGGDFFGLEYLAQVSGILDRVFGEVAAEDRQVL